MGILAKEKKIVASPRADLFIFFKYFSYELNFLRIHFQIDIASQKVTALIINTYFHKKYIVELLQ